MSADKYVTCPRCAKVAASKREKAIAKAQAQYGKVPAAEYRRLIGEAEALPEQPEKHTLAEYYEFIIDETGFFVDFRASCYVCGFSHEYKVTTPVEV
jgi:hypothetical protein